MGKKEQVLAGFQLKSMNKDKVIVLVYEHKVVSLTLSLLGTVRPANLVANTHHTFSEQKTAVNSNHTVLAILVPTPQSAHLYLVAAGKDGTEHY